MASAANSTLTMSDIYGDGWNGFTLKAYTTQNPGGKDYTLVTGSSESRTITDLLGLEVLNLGGFPDEVSYTVNGTTGSTDLGSIHDFCEVFGKNSLCWMCGGHGLDACGGCGGPITDASTCDFTPKNLTELKAGVTLCLAENATGWCPTLAGTNVPGKVYTYGAIGSWDTSQVTSFYKLFDSASAFNQPIGDWDTSSVSTLAYTFRSASAFNQPIGDWDVSNVESLYATFYQASAFNQDLTSWVTTLDTEGTFQYSGMCPAVKGGACNCAGDMRVDGVCPAATLISATDETGLMAAYSALKCG